MADEQSELNNEEQENQPKTPEEGLEAESSADEQTPAGDENLNMPDMDFANGEKADDEAGEDLSADISADTGSDFEKTVNPEDANEDDAEAEMLKMMEQSNVLGDDEKVVNPEDASEDDAEAEMLKMMEQSAGAAPEEPVVQKASFSEFSDPPKQEPKNLNLLMDVSLPISIELGRTAMAIEDILNLGPGSVVELDKLAGEPVDLLVNNKLLAKGEVVVIDENFGVRITNMVSKPDRIRSLQ